MLIAFFTFLFMVQDSTEGQLHTREADLPLKFDADDIIMTDPLVWHSILSRNKEVEIGMLTSLVICLRGFCAN